MQDKDVRKRNILLVEDHLASQRVVTAILRDAGYEAEATGKGERALRLLETQTFDLIIMDCMLQGMDGYDTARAIRQGDAGEGAENVPIVALTGLLSDVDKEKCKEAGMDGFLQKPVNAEELLKMAGKFLDDPYSGTGKRDKKDNQSPVAPAGHDDAFSAVLEGLMVRFRQDLPTEIAQFRDAMETRNLEELQQLAHRLRGSAGVFSLSDLTHTAESLERAAKSGHCDEALSTTHQLLEQLGRLLADSGDK